MQDTLRSAFSASVGASGYHLASGKAQVAEEPVLIFEEVWLFGIIGNEWLQLGGLLLLALTIIERALAIHQKWKAK